MDFCAQKVILEVAQECIICLDPILYGMAPYCGHIFHSDCLKWWLESSESCPVCRKIISGTTVGCNSAESNNESELERNIELVMQLTGAPESNARKALDNSHGDIAMAVVNLTA